MNYYLKIRCHILVLVFITMHLVAILLLEMFLLPHKAKKILELWIYNGGPYYWKWINGVRKLNRIKPLSMSTITQKKEVNNVSIQGTMGYLKRFDEPNTKYKWKHYMKFPLCWNKGEMKIALDEILMIETHGLIYIYTQFQIKRLVNNR